MMMVSPITVRSWAKNGDLNAITTAGGHRRFKYEDILRFADEKNIELQINETTSNRLLIVDDDPSLASYLYESLIDLAEISEIKIANNGFQTGSLVQSFKPHIILLDLMMPGLNGFQVCEQLKQDKATKETRIIAMTGFHNDDNTQKIITLGAEKCLRKPFDHKELLEAINFNQSTLQNA